VNRNLVLLYLTAALMLLSAPSSGQAKTIPGACDPRAYGAKGDGQSKDTGATQAAIDACAAGRRHRSSLSRNVLERTYRPQERHHFAAR
jgi:hypothetical protein